MRIVIDMPYNQYAKICAGDFNTIGYFKLNLRNAFRNGTLIEDIGEFSDGYHTFNSLYKQRMFLFAALVKVYKDKAWKSLRHEDGELCFGGGWFIVGIDTPEGSYTYHYEDSYYSLFDCEELERGKHWDGHTDTDVKRLMSLKGGAE